MLVVLRSCLIHVCLCSVLGSSVRRKDAWSAGLASVALFELFNGTLDVLYVLLGLFDSRASVAFLLPPRHVLHELGLATPLLVNLLADFADIGLPKCVHDQLEAARLAGPVLSGALAPEGGPLPVPAMPPDHVVIAHGCHR